MTPTLDLVIKSEFDQKKIIIGIAKIFSGGDFFRKRLILV